MKPIHNEDNCPDCTTLSANVGEEVQCPAHSAPAEQRSEWESRFNERFGFGIWKTNKHDELYSSDVVEFIRSLLLSERKRLKEAVEGVVEETIEKMKMEGLEHKLTPFQSTVNTYIKNRGAELLAQLKNPQQ